MKVFCVSWVGDEVGKSFDPQTAETTGAASSPEVQAGQRLFMALRKMARRGDLEFIMPTEGSIFS